MEASSPLIQPAEKAETIRRSAWRAKAESALLAFLVLLFVVRGLIPAWSHLDPVERVYEWAWFQRQKTYVGIDQGLV